MWRSLTMDGGQKGAWLSNVHFTPVEEEKSTRPEFLVLSAFSTQWNSEAQAAVGLPGGT